MLDVTVRKHKVKNSIEVTLLEQLLAPGTDEEEKMFEGGMEDTGREVGSMLDVRVRVHKVDDEIEVSLLELLAPGTRLKGKVTEIKQFAAVLDLEGQTLPGWLHISQVKEGQRFKDMEETGLEVGSMLDVNVREHKHQQIEVSLLELLAYGTKLKGKVIKINKFGAVLDLEGQTLPGWLHRSQVKEGKSFKDMKESGLEVGSMLDVTVRKHKVKNSIEVTLLEQLLAPGTELKGKVTEINEFGAVLGNSDRDQ
eukprot:TRINITY_DN3707_c0_g1_i8.p1 TRINITY_DN3707_c0_g1~~TRINITY_DN3707_c0_g1_i8.p1  ORF type:complete len:253 (-),score=51.69 TRINITY_DN3707_c0_g1_i8:800-1558(-)